MYSERNQLFSLIIIRVYGDLPKNKKEPEHRGSYMFFVQFPGEHYLSHY